MRREQRQESDNKQSISNALQLLAAKREARLQAQAQAAQKQAAAGTTAHAAPASVPLPTSNQIQGSSNGHLSALHTAAQLQLPGEQSDSSSDEGASKVRESASRPGSDAMQPLSRLVRQGNNGAGPSSRAAADVDSLLRQMADVTLGAASAATGTGSRRMQYGGMHGRHSAQSHSTAGEGALGDGAGSDEIDNSPGRGTMRQHGTSKDPSPSRPAAAQPPVANSAALLLEGGYELPGAVAGKLYPHQVEGVRWLWSLHRVGKGGILGDDMGLGKTMQVSAFLAGLLKQSKHGRRALVVAPKTLLAHWQKELAACGLSGRVHCFFGASEGERGAALRAVCSAKGGGGVLLTTYGMVLHNAALLTRPHGGATGSWGADVDEDDDGGDGMAGPRLRWDWLILDEGHKVKNPRMQLAQRLRELHCQARLIISGTPIQNNLGELHALFDLTTPGLLGDAKAFKARYERPISVGQDRNSSGRAREAGAAAAAELRRVISPFLLRREKKEVFGDGPSAGAGVDAGGSKTGLGAAVGAGASSSGAAAAAAGGVGSSSGDGAAGGAASGSSSAPVPGRMGKKNDVVVWLRLSALQRHVYEAFLHSDDVRTALNSSRSPLAALTVLKKVCDHPALLSERAARLVVSAGARFASKGHKGDIREHFQPNKKGPKRRNSLDDFIVDDSDDEAEEQGSGDEDSSYGNTGDGCSNDGSDEDGSTAAREHAAPIACTQDWCSWASGKEVEAKLLADLEQKAADASCKSAFVLALLRELAATGHRVLVFSQSRVMLNILQAAVSSLKLSFCRIDGSMASAEARQAEVARFQAPGSRIPVFLLTSQVGGLGLTLTAADRVIIVDPSWNPATDNQSVDRAYRIGQQRDVVVYRLITCGTVEEKIYRKQVFKGGLSRTGTQEGEQQRYFTHQELHQLFAITEEGLVTSETQQMLNQLHGGQRHLPDELAEHLQWVESWPGCAGTSDHDLLFSEQQGGGNAGARQGGVAGPTSADELGDMLHTLSLGGGASQPRWQQQRQQRTPQQCAVVQQQALVQGLEAKVKQCAVSLQQLAARLADGGAKLRQQLQTLHVELDAARQQLQLMMGPSTDPAAAPAAPPSTTASSNTPAIDLLDASSSNSSSAGRSMDQRLPHGAGAGVPSQQGHSWQDRGYSTSNGSSSKPTALLKSLPPAQQLKAGPLQPRAPPTLVDITNSPATSGMGPAVPPTNTHQTQQPAAPHAQPRPQEQADAVALWSSAHAEPGTAAASSSGSGEAQQPDAAQLSLRKHVLKKELYRLEGAIQTASGAGDRAEQLRLKRLQRPLYEEYREVKALLEASGEADRGMAASGAVSGTAAATAQPQRGGCCGRAFSGPEATAEVVDLT